MGFYCGYFFVKDYISYTDAEIKHETESGAILEFVDFWTNSTGKSPKMLIFDSKPTSYANLNLLLPTDFGEEA